MTMSLSAYSYWGEYNSERQSHGYGMTQFIDGDYWEGEHQQGKPHGQGRYWYGATGFLIFGRMQHGVLSGVCRGIQFYVDPELDVESDPNYDPSDPSPRVIAAEYEGDIVNYLSHGQGTYTMYHPVSLQYTGEWVNDKFHGQGELVDEDGDIHKGRFKQGKLYDGAITYKEGNPHKVKVVSGVSECVHGASCDVCGCKIVGVRYMCSDCDNYDLCQGCFSAKRTNLEHQRNHTMYIAEYTLTVEDGEDFAWYNGEIDMEKKENGELEFHGYGKIVYVDGSWHQGVFRDGVAHGKGRRLMSGGDRYVGLFVDGMFHGEGRYDWSDGSWYEGSYVAGLFQGYGVHCTRDGTYRGQWDGGAFDGEGTLDLTNHGTQGDGQAQITGLFSQGELVRGTMTTDNGTRKYSQQQQQQKKTFKKQAAATGARLLKKAGKMVAEEVATDFVAECVSQLSNFFF